MHEREDRLLFFERQDDKYLAVKHKVRTLVKAHVGVGEETSDVVRKLCR